MNLRLLLSASLLLFLQTFSEAQLPDFRAGIKGGLNISKFHAEESSPNYIAAGYHAGIFVRIPLTDHISIQPEAQYSIKGARINEAFGQYLSKADLRLEYVDAIALLNLKFAKIINLQGGLVLGILTDAGIENRSDNPENIDLETTADRKDFRLFDPGYALGIEIDFLRLVGGFRYTHGLRNISDEINYQGSALKFPELRNSVYQLYFGLRIL